MAAQIRLVLSGVLALVILAGLTVLVANRPAGRPVQLLPPAPTGTPEPLRVHVSGEVARPGVYSFRAGSIVRDAVDAAGGPTGQADLGRLNLAAPLVDGQQVLVPAVGQTLPTEQSGQTIDPVAPGLPNRPVNINAATAAELETLPEIGPVTAALIVEYRTTHGPFETIEDIQKVNGIGPKTFEAIRDLIVVE